MKRRFISSEYSEESDGSEAEASSTQAKKINVAIYNEFVQVPGDPIKYRCRHCKLILGVSLTISLNNPITTSILFHFISMKCFLSGPHR